MQGLDLRCLFAYYYLTPLATRAARNSSPGLPGREADAECLRFSLNLLWDYPRRGSILNVFRMKTVRDQAYVRFQQLLIEERRKANLTQAELSLRLKRPQSFVSKYERGERRLDVVEFGEVARALSVSPLRFLEKLFREIS